MKRRFLVLAGGLSADQQSAFSSYVAGAGFSWWHWIDNAWLLTTSNQSELVKRTLVDKIKELASDANRWVVMELNEDIDWTTGSATNQKGRKISDWIKETWGGDD